MALKKLRLVWRLSRNLLFYKVDSFRYSRNSVQNNYCGTRFQIQTSANVISGGWRHHGHNHDILIRPLKKETAKTVILYKQLD